MSTGGEWIPACERCGRPLWSRAHPAGFTAGEARKRDIDPGPGFESGRSGADDGISGPVRYDDAFDRIPPQDLEAEMATLGGMLLSKEAITDVLEVLRGT